LKSLLETQRGHGDQLEKEVEKLNNEKMVQEGVVIEALAERDKSRQTVAELQA
jgi:hypothetical protein